MKANFFSIICSIIIFSFLSCQEEPIPEPPGPEPGWTKDTEWDPPFAFNQYPYDYLVIDSVEYWGINYFDPGIDISISPYWTGTHSLDLNEDGQNDIELNLAFHSFLNGDNFKIFEFNTLNSNCSIIGSLLQDTIAEWRDYDPELDRYCYTTIFWDSADINNYDTLLSLTPRHIIELPVIPYGDTIFVSDPFESLPNGAYVFMYYKYGSVDYNLSCYYRFINQGIWTYETTGYVGFKITEVDKETIGWFKVDFQYDYIKIDKVAYVDLEI